MTRARGWVSRIQGSVPTGHLRSPLDLASLLPLERFSLNKRTLPTGHLKPPQDDAQPLGDGNTDGGQGASPAQSGGSNQGDPKGE